MPEFLTLVLATLWFWESVRYAAERYAGRAFAATRAVHPLVVAALPLAYLWPDWLTALAVAGSVGLLHLAVGRFLSADSGAPQVVQRPRSRGGLPPLP